jgi:hypothetical protein
MTSRSGVDAVLRELRFGAVSVAAAAGFGVAPGADDARFRFVTDFDSSERWPECPLRHAAPSARHDDITRSRIASVLDEAARTMARRAPAALRWSTASSSACCRAVARTLRAGRHRTAPMSAAAC